MQKSGLELSVRNPTFPDPFFGGKLQPGKLVNLKLENPEL